ncbi:hypothetical protein CGLO_12806 [Colletotrichum gloeosporioides Cg-14]|uniref:Uncharacterized protein n=1 Tax=Colletotrichum gloeosporioides (strain Cg-14) TaxID=1237896 RepID=T0JXT9_COLGC|nr:hypothetical protein CGLO_12806 [Colletotrichum gloeosporioides Cg-14]
MELKRADKKKHCRYYAKF